MNKIKYYCATKLDFDYIYKLHKKNQSIQDKIVWENIKHQKFPYYIFINEKIEFCMFNCKKNSPYEKYTCKDDCQAHKTINIRVEKFKKILKK